ncbi:MAG: HAD-IB family phosphatase [Candidatus Bathyarchaeia archaeon]|jgi:2,3-diketo-5-methylthio-1-phosphopentane phosphatase
MPERIVVLSDFDGTVVEIDTGAFVLTEFANGDWQRLERQFESGEISFEQCLRSQFGMITHPKEEILKKVETVSIRPYFVDVVNYCHDNGIGFKLVSGGLDFCIKRILERNKLKVDVICPKTTFTCDGLKLEFPKLSDVNSLSFKDDTVRSYRRENYSVLFVGDGYADYSALKEADLRFVMKDSVSAKLFHASKLEFTEVTDFEPVLNTLANGRNLMRVN